MTRRFGRHGNSEVYNILKTAWGIKGIYSIFPLDKENYEAVLQGKLEEGELSDFLLDYREPKEVYLYLISLIVDIHDPQKKNYASAIIKNIPSELKRLEKKGIIVKEVGAMSISYEGEKILPKIGFRNDGQKLVQNVKKYLIFQAKPEDIIREIKI